MQEQQYFERIFSIEHNLSQDVPSNSRFLAIRELEADIKRQILPLLVLLSKDKSEAAKVRFRALCSKFMKEGSQFHWIYIFAQDLGEGILEHAEIMPFKQFKAFHESRLEKAFSFKESMEWLDDIIDSFIEKVSEGIKDQLDKFARNISAGINSLANSVFQQGLIAQMLQGRDPSEVFITKVVYPGACKYCIQTYLTPSGAPKVFRLSDLIANGDSLQRKPAEYKPVFGGLHYNCRCTNLEVSKDISEESLIEVFDTAVVDYTEARKQILEMQEYEEVD